MSNKSGYRTFVVQQGPYVLDVAEQLSAARRENAREPLDSLVVEGAALTQFFWAICLDPTLAEGPIR